MLAFEQPTLVRRAIAMPSLPRKNQGNPGLDAAKNLRSEASKLICHGTARSRTSAGQAGQTPAFF